MAPDGPDGTLGAMPNNDLTTTTVVPEVAGVRGQRAVARFEGGLRRFASNPVPFFLVPLAVTTLVVLAFRVETLSEGVLIAGTALAAGVWYLAWLRFGERQDTPARRLAYRLTAFVGPALLAVLVFRDPLFTIAIIPLMPRLFITLPLWWGYFAALSVVLPVDLAFREMVRDAGPDSNVPLTISIIRATVLLAIGLFFKTMAENLDEKQRLIDELAQSERKAGMLEERQRLAREIHDTLAQGFAAILAHLETAELARARDGQLESRHVGLARSVARESLEEARRMMAALRPEVLEIADLPAAMQRLAEGWSERTGVPCVCTVTGTPAPLHPDIEVALLRCAQEALSNAWKHARAGRAAITLSYMDDVVILDVRDDGLGGAVEGGLGFGLRSITERIEQIGGRLILESTPGEGTTVTASVPFATTTAEIILSRQEKGKQQA
jgi:signal transduction histidine kinase